MLWASLARGKESPLAQPTTSGCYEDRDEVPSSGRKPLFWRLRGARPGCQHAPLRRGVVLLARKAWPDLLQAVQLVEGATETALEKSPVSGLGCSFSD